MGRRGRVTERAGPVLAEVGSALRLAALHALRTMQTDPLFRKILPILAVSLAIVLALSIWAEMDAPAWVAHHFDLSRDRSLAEVYGYVLSGTTALLLLGAWRRWRAPLYLAFSLLFAFALVDDAFSYHENMARHVLKPLFDLPRLPGLRLQDTGELLAWALAALVLAVPAALALLRPARNKLAACLLLALPAVLLAGFAVGADMVHGLADGYRAKIAAGLIEDGGELCALALAATFSLIALRSPLSTGGDGEGRSRDAHAKRRTAGRPTHEPLRPSA